MLTGASVVKELMERRSGSTADRPPNHMADVVTGGLNLVLARYSELFDPRWPGLHSTLNWHHPSSRRLAYLAQSCPCHSHPSGLHAAPTDPASRSYSADVRHLEESRSENALPPLSVAEPHQLSQGFYTHVRRYSSSVILSVLFGKRAPRYETHEV